MGASLLRQVFVSLVLAGALLLAGAVAGFFFFVASLDRFERVPSARADGIVVLTGGSQRVGDAIDLLSRGYGGRLLITGVNEKTSRDVIARFNPGQRQLLECCVDLDYRARNTIENAIETRRWVRENKFGSIIVVTSTYHMPRTLAELDHVLPGARKVPFAVVTDSNDPDYWWSNPQTARVMIAEYVKFLAVWLRTRIERDPEDSVAAGPMHLGTGGRRLAGIDPPGAVPSRVETR